MRVNQHAHTIWPTIAERHRVLLMLCMCRALLLAASSTVAAQGATYDSGAVALSGRDEVNGARSTHDAAVRSSREVGVGGGQHTTP